jgi:hypothetical protein
MSMFDTSADLAVFLLNTNNGRLSNIDAHSLCRYSVQGGMESKLQRSLLAAVDDSNALSRK